jgi:nucleotide-binding universal stress UspA family protein/multisubunit Na+/H+ antiporter MnhG subunit
MLDSLLGGVGVILLLGGCTLATIGLYGLILKPDIFEQLHVAGLVTGPAVVLLLLASIGTGRAEIVTSALLIVAFVLVTSSISTHVIAQTAARRYAEAMSEPTGRRAMSAGGVPTATGPVGVDRAADGGAQGMRVIIGHDGSSGADLAARLAASIDWPSGTAIRIVRAAPAEELAPIDALSPAKSRPVISDQELDEPALRAAALLIERPGVTVETAAVRGDAADVIADEAVAFRADLLIIGSRRRGFVQSLVGSSPAGEVVDRAPCPVLVARSTVLRTVMLTTDGSSQSAVAVELVARWPIFDLTRIHVVTVSSDAPPARTLGAGSPSAEGQRTVDAVAALLMDAGRDVVSEVLHGRPGARIAEEARAQAVDLIVIGSRGRTGLGRTLLGSVAGDLLTSASCSVLIVAPPPRQP